MRPDYFDRTSPQKSVCKVSAKPLQTQLKKKEKKNRYQQRER